VAESGETTGKQTEMGRKSLVPYGLYRAHGFFNPHFAAKTGATAEDLDLFWTALQMMWDLDRSASRGMMACRGLYIFTHDSSLGNAPAHKLLERVRVEKRADVIAPRSFGDYILSVNDADMPNGVTLTPLVEG
jgi:CRISPR-associated protein Csd2